ncbi:kynureninase [Wenzhouxiangella marina]|uniref:Kynureninase n=1 Tax=Wenzhouxiangella marina TaxID=1579979 RepID=A0A0K0XXU2_9GAMM|nr:kynureninase [Wenzhouxiangella marina]AKS42495.1 Kynureninase [Wenzhouxiangella marina]MBB6085730.1 kynureninase [Wenzhouxiangella marina]
MSIHRTDTDYQAGDFRERFRIPPGPDGEDCLYFCGNSLGLQPQASADAVTAELERWAGLGVAGHFDGPLAWMPYHRLATDHLARLVGAKRHEVVAMNSLTVNLHLMMVSFFRPSGARRRIVIERGAFPSDRHAVASQLEFHGLDQDRDLVELAPRRDGLLHEEDLEDYLERFGDQVALVLWPGVQYATGQAFDMERIARACQRAGVMLGLDLAHAVGNLPLELNAWGCDFAVWCSYKYLNAGPGAVAGCFVHERHAKDTRPRFAGWWGHDEKTRFRMGPDFEPMRGAEGWQLSNPPVLALAALWPSLEIFSEAGIQNLRQASLAMTGHLAQRINDELADTLQILTPMEPHRRGCQLSLRVRSGRHDGRLLFERLEGHGVIADWREPDIIRVAPVPLYNRIEDCDRLIDMIKQLRPGGRA